MCVDMHYACMFLMCVDATCESEHYQILVFFSHSSGSLRLFLSMLEDKITESDSHRF